MRILITGKNGQVGWELQRSLQCLGEVVAVDRAQFDLAEPETLRAKLDQMAPDVIVNAAAYTAVDKAESEEALATRINGESPGVMAAWAAGRGALMIHYSTDYVFDGSGTTPWQPTDVPAPLSAYGRSKLAGEHAIVGAASDHLILRTSWVYAARGRNFLLTVLRLAAERDQLRVVDDQWGAPTPARLIADVTAQVLRQARAERSAGPFASATLHLAASGHTTWCRFALEILQTLGDRKATMKAGGITAIPTDSYPTAAKRPLNSRLSCSLLEQRFSLGLPDWRTGLQLCLEELAEKH